MLLRSSFNREVKDAGPDRLKDPRSVINEERTAEIIEKAREGRQSTADAEAAATQPNKRIGVLP